MRDLARLGYFADGHVFDGELHAGGKLVVLGAACGAGPGTLVVDVQMVQLAAVLAARHHGHALKHKLRPFCWCAFREMVEKAAEQVDDDVSSFADAQRDARHSASVF